MAARRWTLARRFRCWPFARLVAGIHPHACGPESVSAKTHQRIHDRLINSCKTRLRMSRWGSLHITSVFLIILGTISVANVVQTASEIPWKEMGSRIATIWTGEGTDE